MLGAFVDGAMRGATFRDTMDNNKRLRAMEDKDFERSGERHDWAGAGEDRAQEMHEARLAQMRRAAARGNRPTIADVQAEVHNSPPVAASMSVQNATGNPQPLETGSTQLSFGRNTTPAAGMSLPNADGAVTNYVYDPQRGLIPE
jgi:hypothetical protein